MSLISDIRGRLLGGSKEEERMRRYTCNACDSKFSEAESTADVTCPECGESERVFRL